MTEQQREEFLALLDSDTVIWRPTPGPQRMALESLADVVGYGGAAGGGKTDLAIGLACTQHQRIGIFRENGTELTAIDDRLRELLAGRGGTRGRDIWRYVRADGKQVQIELGSFPNPGDEEKYRGRPHDLLVFDEAATMRRRAPEFLMGWLRTTDPTQRCRVLMTFNPPQRAEGRWVIEYFAPWLDKKHPNPAKPGELRWFARIDGKDREVAGSAEFTHKGEVIRPNSRTFVPSRVKDNPYLAGTDYERRIMAMPEPLRSQLLYGDFQAGVKDDPFQVIPTEWIEAAMARWTKPAKLAPMDSTGVDVALGGDDNTVIARRHGMWFDVPIVYEGRTTKDGAVVAGWCIAATRDRAPIHIDLFGVGSQPYGYLMQAQQQVLGINMGEQSTAVSKDGRLRFRNVRTQLWWQMREALDPINNTGICLPPDQNLLADLAAPLWEMAGPLIIVESRDEIVKRIGRSPDHGTAYILALLMTPKMTELKRIGGHDRVQREYDPLAPLRDRPSREREYRPGGR